MGILFCLWVLVQHYIFQQFIEKKNKTKHGQSGLMLFLLNVKSIHQQHFLYCFIFFHFLLKLGGKRNNKMPFRKALCFNIQSYTFIHTRMCTHLHTSQNMIQWKLSRFFFNGSDMLIDIDANNSHLLWAPLIWWPSPVRVRTYLLEGTPTHQ